MLTLTETALHTQRPATLVDHDHRVRTVGLASAAEILDLIPGAEYAIIEHVTFRSEH